MLITLVREPSTPTWTLGSLFVDGRFQCYTCEDIVRPPGAPKVAGQTAIPSGRYRVIVSESPRFKTRLPLLVGVPGFSGIRIHSGNTPEHTDGCILPGTGHNAQGVTGSKPAFDRLFGQILAAITGAEQVWMEISQRDVRSPAPPADPAPRQAAAAAPVLAVQAEAGNG